MKSIFKRGLQDSVEQLPGGSLRTAMAALAAGKCDDSPFPKDVIDRVRMDLRLALKKDGFGDGLPEEGDVDQITEVRLMRALLEAFKDPDFYFCTWWARGVWIGAPDRVLPRAPALYDRKTKWPKHDESVCLHGKWKANYPSMKEHEAQVLKQFDAEIDEGMMVDTTLGCALDEYGDRLLLAATGAIAKKGHGPDSEVRVIFDGTNGVFLNVGIKIRDQILSLIHI